eukprot:CAMPEP_0118680686 /NCGR_PEP_ID=MMETSP0800-20121206/4507_1 /TAXON_ID=210618 ORGANISM="Striatella unipunctata, Strain CCMP2910" /NCGR_SAMPLE_ID=MMETSP0800 /ASSEMBLY_ACC=CAM_ASM_000638 /LENGTH=130 /DNA_ID=CAMNT_0006576871 /DNA_START=154 /DNA_END=543 /DNA_ORIENTATION=+
MALALHYLFAKGSSIAEGFLDAAGPNFVASMMDHYFAQNGVDFPSIVRREAVPFPYWPGKDWTKIDTVRFGNLEREQTYMNFGLVHLHFGSWFPNTPEYDKDRSKTCEENLDLIPSFLDQVCENNMHGKW